MADSKAGPGRLGDSADASVPLIVHGRRAVNWQQSQRGGSREDRMMRQTTVRLPPTIADYQPRLGSLVAAESEGALAAIAQLDAEHGPDLAALSTLLLRAESVASSKIERIEASVEDFARAAHGIRSNPSATSMVASADALNDLILSVEGGQPITLEKVLSAHRILMADDPYEARDAGRIRTVQNWIGGSDYSPRGAQYVPPPPETVEDYLGDLLAFANRSDVPVLVQAAIVHAQFESIHPFTDGNGRIGRALINTVFRRRGATSQVVVPLASALVAKRDTYFEVLAAYREGDAGPLIRMFALAARSAANESRVTAQNLTLMPADWEEQYAESTGRKPRANSAAASILTELPNTPFFAAEEMSELIGKASSSVYSAIEKLAEVGVLQPLTNRKRKQVWCVPSIVDELEDLGARIESRTSLDPLWPEIVSQTALALKAAAQTE